jgi:DNA-binding MarR family transcriptional regulator
VHDGSAETPARWLDHEEMRAWRAFVETVGDLLHDLDADLVARTPLSFGDYQVLVYLSEAEGQALRMCDLAARLRLSPSGLTRRLDGLVAAGIVARDASADDRRVTLARLTDRGRAVLDAAAPVHVASVRRRLLDPLRSAQVRALAEIFEAVRAAQPGSDDR